MGNLVVVVAVVAISAGVMFMGAALVFGFSWERPFPVAAVVFGYCVSVAGLTAFIASVAAKEKRADTINTIVIMALAVLGGTMFQVDQLPHFIRDYVSAYLPTTWFIGTVRSLQDVSLDIAWVAVAVKLCLLGAMLGSVSAFLFHWRLQKGVKPG